MDKAKIHNEDFDKVAYPLIELGWEIGTIINPLLYTFSDWKKRSFIPFIRMWDRKELNYVVES